MIQRLDKRGQGRPGSAVENVVSISRLHSILSLTCRIRYGPAMPTDSFPDIRFQGQLRPSQAEVVSIASRQLSRGQRRLHIVAPPGSGKTVLGLFLWAECVRTPALVLSPNSAIQAQWAARTSLFQSSAGPQQAHPLVSTSSGSPALLTSLTYQSVTLPARSNSNTDLAATSLWVERLIAQEHAATPEAANQWINDLKQRSPEYFDTRLATWRKLVREQRAFDGQALDLLHQSSLDTLTRLKDANVGLIILDECHHLMGHWGRVLAAANTLFDNPIVIGLTATPPDRDGQKPDDIKRYDDYFGPIDYEVPVPAVVRDGFLAPYQDLVYFVRPTTTELAFVAEIDANFRSLLASLCAERPTSPDVVPSLPQWLFRTLKKFELPGVKCESWKHFERRDPNFAQAARVFLNAVDIELPKDVPPIGGIFERLFLSNSQSVADLPSEILETVLDRYIRHGLRRSADPSDQRLCNQAIDRLRLLGIQITETGSQKCASPISRVLGYTQNKVHALIPILQCELEHLDDQLRAVVITDYEKTSAVSADVSHVLNEEAGGAVAAFRALVADPSTNTLDPILMTGSTILVDHDLSDLFLAAANHWLQQHEFDVQLELHDETLFHIVKGSGTDWCPRVYIQMVTQLFQDGITRCLVGTRGLLGEGWDANRINVLIDLTTVTTSMTVNQLRGRSIRLDPLQPNKLSNNWDIICVAPEFARGLDDFHRLCRKHETIYGITDDGAIEKGIGHVHAALSQVAPTELYDSVDEVNSDMLRRAGNREAARELWNIGTGYSGKATSTVEFRIPRAALTHDVIPSTPHSVGNWTTRELGKAIADSVMKSLVELQLLSSVPSIQLSIRHGGYVRIYLENSTSEDDRLFATTLTELMSPFQRPRYMVPFIVDQVIRKPMTGWMPNLIGRMFESQQPQLICYYSVPAAFSQNKNLVQVFQDHWNAVVSDGKAIYCHKGTGQQLMQDAKKQNLTPDSTPQMRECFL